MMAKIRGETQSFGSLQKATWQTLLEAVERHIAECPVEELAWLDAKRLSSVYVNIVVRLTEADAKRQGRIG